MSAKQPTLDAFGQGLIVCEDVAKARLDRKTARLLGAKELVALGSGLEAAKFLRKESVGWIVVDETSFDVSGINFIKLIRLSPRLRDTPVVFLKFGRDPGVEAKAVKAGAHVVLDRPYSPQALLEAVALAADRAALCGPLCIGGKTPVTEKEFLRGIEFLERKTRQERKSRELDEGRRRAEIMANVRRLSIRLEPPSPAGLNERELALLDEDKSHAGGMLGRFKALFQVAGQTARAYLAAAG